MTPAESRTLYSMPFQNAAWLASGQTRDVLLACAAVLLLVLVLKDMFRARKVEDQFEQLAARLHLDYCHSASRGLITPYAGLTPLYLLEQGLPLHVFQGHFRKHPILAFEISEPGHAKDTSTRCFSIYIRRQPRSLPYLLICPTGWLAHLPRPTGAAAAFIREEHLAKSFRVLATEEAFARHICHTRMVQYLLAHPDLALEIEGGAIAVWAPESMAPTRIPVRLQQLLELQALIPEYLYVA